MKTRNFLLISALAALSLTSCLLQGKGNADAGTTQKINLPEPKPYTYPTEIKMIYGRVLDFLRSGAFDLETIDPITGERYFPRITSAGLLTKDIKIGDLVQVEIEVGGLDDKQAQCLSIGVIDDKAVRAKVVKKNAGDKIIVLVGNLVRELQIPSGIARAVTVGSTVYLYHPPDEPAPQIIRIL